MINTKLHINVHYNICYRSIDGIWENNKLLLYYILCFINHETIHIEKKNQDIFFFTSVLRTPDIFYLSFRYGNPNVKYICIKFVYLWFSHYSLVGTVVKVLWILNNIIIQKWPLPIIKSRKLYLLNSIDTMAFQRRQIEDAVPLCAWWRTLSNTRRSPTVTSVDRETHLIIPWLFVCICLFKKFGDEILYENDYRM